MTSKKPKIAIITLIQEGAVKLGGEHAMMFPYVEQIIRSAELLANKIEIIPYIISPRPSESQNLSDVDNLIKKMKQTNNGKMILVSNGIGKPYGHPWNWEKYGYEAAQKMEELVEKEKLSAIIIMGHGFASIPAILNINMLQENNSTSLNSIPILLYYITHSSFDEHKDSRVQRRLLEKEIQHHAKMIAISPYMSKHLEEIGMIDDKDKTIPLYNALPENGWYSRKVSPKVFGKMIEERNSNLGKGPFYGKSLPYKEIIAGKKELVVYFGRPQKYVKGTDAVLTCAQNDSNRHYFVICSGSDEELEWHKQLIKNLDNVTLAWEHNSTLVLGTIQLTEHFENARITALFLSRREPMGLVSREVILMQDNGAVLPIVSGNCGFEDPLQRKYSHIVTNPCECEDIKDFQQEQKYETNSDLFINYNCVKETLQAIDKISNTPLTEIRERVANYKKEIKDYYSQKRYLSFYLQAITKIFPVLKHKVEDIFNDLKLKKIPNI